MNSYFAEYRTASDALRHAQAAEDAWTRHDSAACLAALTSGHDCIVSAAQRGTDPLVYRLVETTRDAVRAAADGMEAPDAAARVRLALDAIRHAAGRLDATAVGERDRPL